MKSLPKASAKEVVKPRKASGTSAPRFEKGLLKALENTPKAGIYVIHNGKFVFINDFTANRSGYTKEEMIGMDAITIVHSDDRESARVNAIDMLKGKRSNPYAFRTISREGEIHWITETLSPITYKGKRSILGTSLDITEQIQAQNQLEELRALEASVLEAIPHAVLGLADNRIIFANNGVKTVFGWHPEELVGKDVRILYRSETEYTRFMRNLYLTLERQRTFYTELSCRFRDGADMDCLISASRIGEFTREHKIVITYEDITDRKRIGKELEQSRKRLRHLSAHLEEAREKERTHIARELHDELGQLLTALHTDLVLLTNQISPKQKKISETTSSMVKLIDMIMTTLKRIYMDLRPAVLDHLGLTAAVFWQAQEFQKRTGIHCDVTIEPEDMVLDMDLSLAIFRILQETLTNVSRHADAGNVEITLKHAGNRVDLTVRDDGKGISDEQLNKPDSFGLLGIRERTYYWGGEVNISGREGKGTTVSVSLPLRIA
ncbi:MAG: PAS domain S-box protein [Syntrophales bacterium]|nr:PAS domain S-box protein [Syntrophales bacterium]